MKKIIPLLSGLLIFAAVTFAQPVNCDFGLDQKTKLLKGDSYQEMVGADNTGFYVLRVDYENSIWLEYWNGDNQTKETSNRLILPSVSGVQAEYTEMYYLDGNLILFTTVTNESIKQKTLYMQNVNKSGKIIGESKPIGRLTNQNIVIDFQIDLTKNGKNIFVHYNRPFQMYNDEPYFFKIYNSKMEEVLNKTVKLPLVDREFNITQYIVTRDGDIMMLAQMKPKDERSSKRSRGPQVYQYSVLIYDIELSKITEYPMTVEKYIPQNAILGVNEKDKFIDVMGFMAKKNKIIYSGIFHERMDLETKEWAVVDRKTSYYNVARNEERNFRAEHLIEQRENIYNYQLRSIEYLSTGEPVMFAEHTNTWMDSIIDPATKQIAYNNYYKFNDIIIGKIDRDNKFEWMTRIPKSQVSYNDFGDYSSYGISVIGEKIKLFYNGNYKNLKMLANDMYDATSLKAIKSPSRKGRALTTTVFSDGKVFGSYMFDSKHKKQVIMPGMMTDYQGKYYIFTKKGTNIKFSRFYID